MLEEVSIVEEVIEGYRLSHQQRRLWLLQTPEAETPYRARFAARLAGRLRPELLRDAARDVVGRHEALRTSFRRHPGVKFPVQVIAAEAEPEWRVHVLTSLEPSARAEEAEGLYREEGRRPFDLARPSLLRLTLLRLSDEEHLLYATLPALCADARSLDNLLNELALSYAARAEGVGEWDEPAQYLQFSEWQNELLEEGDEEGEAHWRAYELAARPAATLPLEGRRPGARFEPEVLSVAVAPATAARVEEAARACGSTAAEFLSACWHALLWRLTGQPEVDVARVCDGRKYAELEDSVGLFAKWLPVRCRFGAGYRLGELAARVRREAEAGDDWQEYFIWGRGGSPAEETGYPAFGFDYEEMSLRRCAAGVTFELERRDACFDRFKVKLSCVRAGGGLTAEFHYDAGLFERAAVESLAASFEALLADATASPGASLEDLEVLGAAERVRVLRTWNETEFDYPRASTLHGLFEAQAARTPDAVAVVFGEEQLTYGELNRRANQLANYLRGGGVGAESRVGLMMERSAELMVALLGVLKAGGAYVPLDPDYPEERLAYMAEDAGLVALVTQERLAARLAADGVRTVCVDAGWEEIARSGDENPRGGASADSLVYVMYTSGSTGRPKGAMLPHRGVVNCLLWMQSHYRLRETDRFLLKGSLSFDASVWEAFWPLLVGAGVVVARPGGQHDVAYLVEEINRREVTVAYFVPPMLQVFLGELNGATVETLRYVICGGEALSPETLERFLAVTSAELHHSYGPTEASIAACEWTCRPGLSRPVTPIGRPLGNTQLYVLDARLRPVPVGVAGELYIGGVGVGRGYFNRPALTAERFVPDAYSAEPGARLYRTGDLVRYLPNGDVEFIGRTDEQVKVRGMRIELGEIEAVLAQHPALKDVCVAAREDRPGDKQLVAYVVAGGASAPAAGELRDYLAGRLPAHMVPSAFVTLERLPLTPSGKVDRRALPAPDRARAESADSYVAPRTPAEEMLAAVWAEILQTERVGVDDNFFELGGHSLLATQVISRVREAFQVELPLRALFESPTVEELAEVIEAELRGGASLQAPPIVAAPRTGPLPLSFAQQRLWFLNLLDPDSAFYNIPIAVRLRGALNVAALEQTLTEVVRRHESLRTVFPKVNGQPAQVILPPGRVPLPVTDLSGLPEAQRKAEMQLFVAQEAQRPFDLAEGPLLRADLVRMGEEEHVALLTAHHIVSDGWSTAVLIKEVSTLYEAFSAGRPSPLAELPIQYADYACWQREWLQGEVLERQLSYWRRQLAGAPALLELPTDRPRAAARTYRGASHSFLIPGELSDALKELSRREGVTLFMTLLAGFQALLYRYTGQEDVCVGTPIANRNRGEMEGVIGFFVNMLVLRGDLSNNPTMREMVGRVREAALGAYAHQDLPFDKLVGELQPGRDLGHTPLFQVVFKLQDATTPTLELTGLELSPVKASVETMQFDLVLNVTDTERALFTTLSYNTDLFDEATMTRMLGHYVALLEGAAADPARPLLDIPLAGESAPAPAADADEECEQFVFG